ncbi:uncharacterized protein DUF982 [Mesorhizobium sp. J18]|uniref:DUF982 domain-containing protein n=1 Tax=Mesorhizobium sp. J18 TaxID=935263 RepID=UPI00119ABAB9|nr:DUF982 domain-containing protein [Mesorhizobium sp. J18]TWG93788.1 uncharacterized protein DUF982 [Mesorhizobium sp. J18]
MTTFTRPVSIFVGLGFPRDVETVQEAWEVLHEWNGARGPTYAAALLACRSALAGKLTTKKARDAFVAFAKAAGILAPDALETATTRAAQDWLAA